MLGALLRRNMSQKLSVLLLLFGLAWGLMLLRYTVQQPRHQSSAELREQILELSRQYVKVLTEENQNALGGLQGTSMAGYGKRSHEGSSKKRTDLFIELFLFCLLHAADLKRTIAVLLDDILTRLVKLEGKIESVVNASSTNASHSAGGVLASASAALQKSSKQEAPGSKLGTSRLHKHVLNRPHQ